MDLIKINDHLWEIPRTGAMLVPGRIFASAKMIAELREDPALTQVANVACLPGIVGYSLAMPDIHWGYGFPIGGVAAVDADVGVISPGGVGYDINCGVRLARTSLDFKSVQPRVERLADALFAKIPAGVGSEGAIPGLSIQELKEVVRDGAAWALHHGYASERDLEHTEEGGRLNGADPDRISPRAYQRGSKQIGTLGSGNHFLEVSRVDQIYDAGAAEALGLADGQVTVLIHSGSRGLGHQTCDDYLKLVECAMTRYAIRLPDRQLAAVPIDSPEGEAYLGAMAAAANFAWCNRQVMMHLAEQTFMEALSVSPRELGFALVYDVCHNIAKFEEHLVVGQNRRVCVHRKGATRAFARGSLALPELLRPLGQPVLIPGDMGRYSFVLIGLEAAMRETFGSSCHGAGRVMSRMKARKEARGRDLNAELKAEGVTVRARSRGGVAEEMPYAYKDVAEVVEVMEAAGVTRRVARLKPFAVVKG
jgi:tRNA-splicing ligase RtcB (3'-phosphate/5'-hydroxy nucleic acid ligase)